MTAVEELAAVSVQIEVAEELAAHAAHALAEAEEADPPDARGRAVPGRSRGGRGAAGRAAVAAAGPRAAARPARAGARPCRAARPMRSDVTVAHTQAERQHQARRLWRQAAGNLEVASDGGIRVADPALARELAALKPEV